MEVLVVVVVIAAPVRWVPGLRRYDGLGVDARSESGMTVVGVGVGVVRDGGSSAALRITRGVGFRLGGRNGGDVMTLS